MWSEVEASNVYENFNTLKGTGHCSKCEFLANENDQV